MKKVSNINSALEGDDGFYSRLLSYLQSQIPFKIDSFTQIGNNVYKVKTKQGFPFILKGYSSLSRLEIQETFTASLKNSGFPNTYSFYNLTSDASKMFFQTHYYGCLEYIQPSENTFAFDSIANCIDGLDLIQSFHNNSVTLLDQYQNILPSFSLVKKWQERYQIFIRNISFLSFFLSKDILSELLNWAKWSLEGIKKEEMFYYQSPSVILHGDVAHHNFIRRMDGSLYLIDFDLISIGPVYIDYLQYANRILPFFNWSYKDLASFKQWEFYFQQKLFLYALVYPTDIFREWNRLIKNQDYKNPKKVRQVMKLTLNQLEKRRQFSNEIMNLVM